MATKTISTKIQIRNDVAANWTSANPVLLAGEIGLETDTDKYKVGDGTKTWSQLAYAYDGVKSSDIDDKIQEEKDDFTTVVPNSGETDAQALARAITSPKKGDIAVIKREITTGKYSYTGYVYNGSAWGAMDGNYSAENVYLTEDITTAGEYTRVGNITKASTTATGTFSVAGKTVAEALTEIFSKRLQPGTPTAPTANFKTYSGASSITVEPGTPISGTVSYELQLNSPGSYTYGPATGVTEDGTYSITYYDGTSTGLTKDTKTGSFNYSFTVGFSNVSVGVSASSVGHTQGVVAKDNLGSDSDPVVRIAAGTKSAGTKTNTWTSSKKTFWSVDSTTGTVLHPGTTVASEKAADSNLVRSLSSKEFGTKKSFSLAIAAGQKRVIIAVPGSQSMKSCIDVDGMGLDVKGNFTTYTNNIYVGGSDATASDIGSYPSTYTVFVCENGAGYAKTTYNITLN